MQCLQVFYLIASSKLGIGKIAQPKKQLEFNGTVLPATKQYYQVPLTTLNKTACVDFFLLSNFLFIHENNLWSNPENSYCEVKWISYSVHKVLHKSFLPLTNTF